ncbi:MAG: DEAD/DEAH box helicase [Flavobacteriales bacterium]
MALKTQDEILNKLGIAELNEMQKEAFNAIYSAPELVLLSPTGSGKTVAFLLPVITALDENTEGVQVLILAPSRELAMQIEQVARDMGSGFKVNAVYGGRPMAKDKIDLQTTPSILIGTPGRVADHMRRESFDTSSIHTLVLDEFDKSLEIGFEEDMKEIVYALKRLDKKILTSATDSLELPKFLGIKQPEKLNFLNGVSTKLQIRRIFSESKDKLPALVKALNHLGNAPGIVFINFRDAIDRVSDYLWENNVSHGCFHGGMEQLDRELSLLKFRNGTHQLLLATDLAARGIDVPEISYIIHYHLPSRAEEFTHRNGRTARMNADGTAYVLTWDGEELPGFIDAPQVEKLTENTSELSTIWTTLHITGGRKDKISKGDIAGLFFKKGTLSKEELGVIEIKQSNSYVAVKTAVMRKVIPLVNNQRLKKKKVRVSAV